MRYLVGDIGGTKTLLAIAREKKKKLVFERLEKYVSREYKGLEDIIAKFLKGEEVEAACFGIAGPVEKDICRTTNLPWIVNAKKISKRFKIDRVFLLNDLQANAYGLNTLTSKDLLTLNKGKAHPEGNRALISAGTGLGESPIYYHEKEHIPSASEGGHSDFAPRNDLEIELFKYLQKRFGHVSYERVVSGQGLFNLYKFLVDRGYKKENPEVRKLMRKEDPPRVISKLGISGQDPACKRAVEWFCTLYAAEAGNFALKVFATGGVYLGGGIAPKIIKAINKKAFLKAFSEKGRFSELLQKIPIHIVLEERTALLGAAYFCRKAVHSIKR